MFGLSEQSYRLFLQALGQFPEIERAEVFGSRAMGDYRPGSDVDVVLYGVNVDSAVAEKLSILLNERLPIPYHFDVLSYGDIESPELVEHIKEFGQPVVR